MKITAIRGLPGSAQIVRLALENGSTVADLRQLIGWAEPHIAIYGERVIETHALAEGDRVEFLRALLADPKESRRKRAANNPLPRTHRPPKRSRAGSSRSD